MWTNIRRQHPRKIPPLRLFGLSEIVAYLWHRVTVCEKSRSPTCNFPPTLLNYSERCRVDTFARLARFPVLYIKYISRHFTRLFRGSSKTRRSDTADAVKQGRRNRSQDHVPQHELPTHNQSILVV